MVITKNVDVLVVGGSVSGSMAAEVLAKGKLSTMLIEKEKTPRTKACSGIQFPYFEKLLGKTIPKDVLSQNQMTKTVIHIPEEEPSVETRKDMYKRTGVTWWKRMAYNIMDKQVSKMSPIKTDMSMYNFMRNTFDDWMNKEAITSGAEFHDQHELVSFVQNQDTTFTSTIKNKKDSTTLTVNSKYLIAADGPLSTIRRQMHPEHFTTDSDKKGGAMNYYFSANPNKDGIKVDEHALYQVYDANFNSDMFAWIYQKGVDRVNTKETGFPLWVVGTTFDNAQYKDHAEKFVNWACKTYNVGCEGVAKAHPSSENWALDVATLTPKDRFFFGDKNLLVVGDAAGLIDAYRGLGMDSAALSAQYAAKCILDQPNDAIACYTKKMMPITTPMGKKTSNSKHFFANNTALRFHVIDRFVLSGEGKKMVKCIGKNQKENDSDKMQLC